MTNYRTGTRLEYDVQRRLRDAGCVMVLRSAGSRGPFDLLALRNNRPPLLVQCKIDRHRTSLREWCDLYEIAVLTNCVPVIADRSGPRRAPRLWTVAAQRPEYGHADEYLLTLPWDDVA